MASPLSWLTKLKGDQLRILAASVGIKTSGTKQSLISALQTRIPKCAFGPSNETFTRRPPTAEEKPLGVESSTIRSILSIDMGIRNLAYCCIRPPSPEDEGKVPKPIVTHWTRKDISAPSIPESSSDISDSGPLGVANFEPDIYAARAYTLLAPLVKHDPPSHVLIERQRFRSMGGFAVQEWTLRVNMFESMLYAVLETLKREGLWKGDVVGVSPARVLSHWIPVAAISVPETGRDSSDTLKAKVSRRQTDKVLKKGKTKSGANAKAVKQHIVGHWLEKDEVVELQGQAAIKKAGYLRKLNKLRGKNLDVDFGKLDDLADCLLQGMAWLNWEENRHLIWEKGEEALAELEKR